MKNIKANIALKSNFYFELGKCFFILTILSLHENHIQIYSKN